MCGGVGGGGGGDNVQWRPTFFLGGRGGFCGRRELPGCRLLGVPKLDPGNYVSFLWFRFAIIQIHAHHCCKIPFEMIAMAAQMV